MPVVILFISWYASKPKNLPPGPRGFPIVGSLPKLIAYRGRLHIYFSELTRKYGPIVCIRVLNKYVIILNDFESIKEAFSGKKGCLYSGRGLRSARKFVTHGKGIFSLEDTSLQENRQFLLSSLHNFGLGQPHYNSRINAGASQLCHLIQRNTEEMYDVAHPVANSIMDTMGHVLFGCHFSKDEIDFLLTEVDQISQVPLGVFMLNASPFMTQICEWGLVRRLFGLESLIKKRKPIIDFFSNVVRNHHGVQGVAPKTPDFVHDYIEEQQKRIGSEREHCFDDEQIVLACVELLIAGIPTTKNAILYGLLLLAKNTSIQDLMYNEIMEVVGKEREPVAQDLASMPLTEATILEILRFSCIAPLGMPHSTTESTNLFGFYIPQYAMVFANLHSIAFDTKRWKVAKQFDPIANFMESNQVVNRDKFLPFSIGRRSCIGEVLGKSFLFLYLVRILRDFQIQVLLSVELHPRNSFKDILHECPCTSFIFTHR